MMGAVWVALLLIVACLVLLVNGRIPPVLVLAGTLTVAAVLQIAPSSALLSGLSSTAVVTIGAMLVVAQGVASTGIVSRLSAWLLGGARTAQSGLIRLLPPVAVLSSLVNNTPVVALSIPAVLELQDSRGIAARRMLLPLAYAATLGGTLTLIGTSSNLISASIAGEAGIDIGMLTFLPVALPAVALGIILLWLVGPRLLSRGDRMEDTERDWRVRLVVPRGSALAGHAAERFNLARTPQVELLAVTRSGQHLPPDARIEHGDVLLFAATQAAIPALWRNPLIGPPGTRLYQATVAPGFQGTLIDLGHAADVDVVAAPVTEDFADAPARAGTVLFIATHEPDQVERSEPIGIVTPAAERSPRPEKTWPALLVFAAVVVLASSGLLPVEWVAVGGAIGMVAVRALTPRAAARALDWNLLGITAGSIGLGVIFVESGLAGAVADGVARLTGGGTLASLALLAVAALMFTNIVTASAAAAMMVPLGLDVAAANGLPALPVVVLVAVCVSFGFINPIATSTNVMVMAPGGYRMRSFARLGGLLTVLVAAVAVAMTWAWITVVA
jgi:di/tricarboxylate transporter